jgi:HAD superfamily hydrolase (TIGR01509 family)
MRFDAIIFDFDGVIVDSEVVSNAALAAVLTRLGHQVTAEEAIERYSGHRWIDCHRIVVEESGLELSCSELRALAEEEVSARVGEVLAIEGVGPFLEAQRHRKLAIASSSETAWLESSLQRLGLSHDFGGRLFSAAGFERGKPHPDIYLHAARELGVEPERCLVIEDHPVGVTAGASAGMTVVALLAAGHIREGHAGRVRAAGAHHVARDYREVSQILEELEKA